jgi:hypothetical protein
MIDLKSALPSAHGMRLSSCALAVILVAAPLGAMAAPVKLSHDLTFPAKASHAANARLPAEATKQQIGSANVATADAPVPRPHEAPCVDTIFSNASFANYAPETFTYAPPAGCPGPYNKIVFNGNFAVSAGIQYDRTASVEIGNVPIFFGTTAEPNPSLAPSWHVERDVTDDAALLSKKQTAEADIFNIVNSTYTGVITGTAYLQFYPAHGHAIPAADTPDVVLPFPGVAGGPQHLNTGSSVLTATYQLPTNVDRAYLDVYAQSQQTDEQYFLCAPNNVAAEIFACGNGPLRETEVSIDGIPAGVAPVYPWIYTGGLDPYLWAPIPGVQTLEFKPFRIDLTPFAATLSNGKPHTIDLSVDNADNYFQGFATLFAYRDHLASHLQGGLTLDTLVPNPPAGVTENLAGTSPSIEGTILVTSTRNYQIAGYLDTPRGRTTTRVASTLIFSNEQTLSNESDFTGTTVVKQTTSDATTVSTSGGLGFEVRKSVVSFPISLTLAVVLDSTGTGTQVTSIDQHFTQAILDLGTTENYASYASNEVTPTDTLDILDDAYITGNANQSSQQTFQEYDTLGTCYGQQVVARNNLVTAVKNGPCNLAAAKGALAPLIAR